MKLIKFFLVSFILFFLAGCGAPKQEDESQASEITDAEQVRDEVIRQLPPSSLAEALVEKGIPYNKALLNTLDSKHRYLGFENKGAVAANLGIYFSDLGYIMAYNYPEEAKPYFFACYQMADFAGVRKQFNRAIEYRFSDLLKGDSELEASMQRLFVKSGDGATGDEFKRLHAAALTGYYFEELYHVVSIIKDHQERGDTIVLPLATDLLLNQKDGVNKLISYFDHIQLRPEALDLYRQVLELQASYLKINPEQLQSSRKKVTPEVEEIVKQIIAVRNRITNL